MLFALAIVWGGSFFFGEIALREVPPFTITLHRVLWAVPILYCVIKIKRIVLPLSLRAWLCYAVMGALNNAIPFSLIFWGQTSIGSGLASILNGTTAVFGAVVAGLLLKDEPLTIRKVMGAIFGVLGVAVIMGVGNLTEFSVSNLGQLAIIGAALSYAFAGVWGKRFLSAYPPMTNAVGMLTCSALIMLPVVLVFDGVPSVNLSVTVWLALIALAALSTALAYLLYFEILVRAGSANLMLVTVLIPPVAITLGALFLGEQLTVNAMLGFTIIAIGLGITDGRLLQWFKR